MIIDSPIISGSYAASGSLNQLGNVVISGSLTVTGSIFGTASFATTASYLSGYVSPFPFTGSAIISGSLTVTGSANIPNLTGSLLGTSSFALTSSYSLSGGGFPYSGSAQITGSLVITNLSGSGVRYLVADSGGNITAQSASAALKSTQAFTATAGQTTFSVTNGYSTGYVDVFINGTKLSTAEFTDTSGTNIILATGSFSGDVVEVVKYIPAAGVTNNVLRQLTTFTATAGQTVFSASYTPGLIDIFYNGARLSTSDYTANNGTFFTLATASVANDVLDVLVYSYQVGAFSGIGGQGVTNQVPFFNTTSSISGSNALTFNGSTLAVTGSFSVYTGSAAEFQVNATGVNLGNAITDTHTVTGSLSMSGSFSTVGTITAQTLVVQTITSSVDFVTGSTRFGSTLSNTHIFSGSVTMNPGGLFVTSSGRVGIGTSTPSELLELSSATSPRVKITNTTNLGNSGIYFNVKDSGSNDLQGGVYYIPGTTTYLTLSGDNVSSHLNVTRAGNVGIGTTNPLSKLSVGGDGYASRAITAIASGTDFGMTLQQNSTGGGLQIYANVSSWGNIPMQIQNNTGYQFIVTTAGNIGIGTGSPTNFTGYTTLTINGTNGGVLNTQYNGTDGLRLGSAANSFITEPRNTFLGIEVNGAERMRITSGGKGLFGTTIPSAGSSGFSPISFHVVNEVVSMGSVAGFFWENRSGGVTVNSNWYGWYTTSGTVYLYNGASNIASINPSNGTYTALSDVNKKKDFEPYTNNALNAVLGLKPTLYRMKDEDETTEKYLGFIAQEVKDYIPQAYVETIAEEKDGGVHIGLNYQAITTTLVKAIQEQQSLITSLQTRIEQLENK
jgi:hypothetical protein